jgi:hypothetical protein
VEEEVTPGMGGVVGRVYVEHGFGSVAWLSSRG